MSDDFIDDFLGGGGGKSAFTKADPAGTTYAGDIVDIGKPMQQTTPDGTLKTYGNGDPMMQMPVTLYCPDKRDASDPDDDGNRTLYVKYKMREAIRDACRKARGSLRKGGHLSVTYTGDDAPARRGESGAKLYSAVYTPKATADEFLEQGGDQAGQGAAASTPATEPPATPAAPAQGGAPAVEQTPAAPTLPADRPGQGEALEAAATRLALPLDVVKAIGGLPNGWDDPTASVMIGMARQAAGANA